MKTCDNYQEHEGSLRPYVDEDDRDQCVQGITEDAPNVYPERGEDERADQPLIRVKEVAPGEAGYDWGYREWKDYDRSEHVRPAEVLIQGQCKNQPGEDRKGDRERDKLGTHTKRIVEVSEAKQVHEVRDSDQRMVQKEGLPLADAQVDHVGRGEDCD